MIHLLQRGIFLLATLAATQIAAAQDTALAPTPALRQGIDPALLQQSDRSLWTRAAGGSATLRLSQGSLKAMQLREFSDHSPQIDENSGGFAPAFIDAYTPNSGVQGIVNARLPALNLRLSGPSGTLQVVLQGNLRFEDERLQGEWLDAEGQIWLRHSHGQIHLPDDSAFDFRTAISPQLEINHIGIRVGPALAAWMKRTEFDHQYLGNAELRMPITQLPAQRSPASCSPPNWVGPNNKADVELTLLSGISQMRCDTCDGPGNAEARVVIAPDATLRNSGTVDVPWYTKFLAPDAPYNNDQHPFLVWEMFRLESDGILRQIGRSGVKHAFTTTNLGCDCPNPYQLGLQCIDTYDAGTNDTPNLGDCFSPTSCFQGVREEILPAQGLFGRCGSLYDPNCDGSQIDFIPYNEYERRMIVKESQLEPQAGVRFFAQGMYVVRDEGNWLNNIGTRELAPQWNGVWNLREQLQPFQQGSVLHRLAGLLPASEVQKLAVLDSSDGKLVILTRAAQISATRWRYTNYVLNIDFSTADLAGAGSNIALTNNRGAKAIEFSASANAALGNASFVDLDSSTGNDWQASVLADRITFSKPNNSSNDLDWGMLFNFVYESDIAPGIVKVSVSNRDGALRTTSILGASPAIFVDGFETAP